MTIIPAKRLHELNRQLSNLPGDVKARVEEAHEALNDALSDYMDALASAGEATALRLKTETQHQNVCDSDFVAMVDVECGEIHREQELSGEVKDAFERCGVNGMPAATRGPGKPFEPAIDFLRVVTE